MVNAVIVVDMQNGFMAPEGTLICGAAAREIIPRIEARLRRESAAGAALFFTQDSHAPDDAEFQMFPPHCVAGSDEEAIIAELQSFASEATIVRKRRYSAFFETDLAARLQALKPEKVVVVGDCTDICILHTVSDLRNRDYWVEVPADCVASFDPEQHEWALGHMDSILGAEITNR